MVGLDVDACLICFGSKFGGLAVEGRPLEHAVSADQADLGKKTQHALLPYGGAANYVWSLQC